jgi:hypothetical protein
MKPKPGEGEILPPFRRSEEEAAKTDEPLSLPLPSLEYLLNCSRTSLQDVELANLNRAANCLKRARIEWNEACAHREAAGVARWLLENREGTTTAIHPDFGGEHGRASCAGHRQGAKERAGQSAWRAGEITRRGVN